MTTTYNAELAELAERETLLCVLCGFCVVTTAVLPGNPFETRSYGGDSKATHQTATETETDVIVVIPGVTASALLNRSVVISFYRIDAGTGSEDVTPQKLNQFKATNRAHLVGQVKADDLKKVVTEFINRADGRGRV